MNSFSAMNRAIDYEISRQILLHSEGQSDHIVQETRLWEEGAQVRFLSYNFPPFNCPDANLMTLSTFKLNSSNCAF